MKNIYVLLLSLSLLTFTFSNCNNYKSITNATKVSELKGNPFIYNVSKSVLSTLKTYAYAKGIKTSTKINLLTPLSSVFNTEDHLGGLKDIITLTYKIPSQKLNKGFSNLMTVKDLIAFIAKNGRGFNFYSRNSL